MLEKSNNFIFVLQLFLNLDIFSTKQLEDAK